MSHTVNRPGRGDARRGASNATSKARSSSYRGLVSKRSTGASQHIRSAAARLSRALGPWRSCKPLRGPQLPLQMLAAEGEKACKGTIKRAVRNNRIPAPATRALRSAS
jgi:hypothetical protein